MKYMHGTMDVNTKLLDLKEAFFLKIQAYPPDQALLIISINYPGSQKLNGFSLFVFYEYLRTINFEVDELIFNELGPIAIKKVDDGYQTKNLAVAFEDSHPLGRLLDLDVYEDGSMLSVDRPLRKCLICDQTAKECMIKKRHGLDEIRTAFESIVLDYIDQDIDKQVSFAMLMELSVHPSFGLVNPLNQGIHDDMNLMMFMRVINALAPSFKAIDTISTNQTPQAYFNALRVHGIAMEAIMFKESGGINTHKGFIFLMLIVLGAQAYYPNQDLTQSIKNLGQFVLDDFKGEATTSGLYWYQKAKIKGVRGQVLDGLNDLIHHKLPYFKKVNSKYDDLNDALVSSLLLIMSDNDDTTILKRSDLETLYILQSHALRVYQTPSEWESFSKWCVDHHLSPGGSADLLGVLVFLAYFFYDKEKESL